VHMPSFWLDNKQTISSLILRPVSWVFQLGALIKAALTVEQSVSIPVICVGNLTVGGAGKTPTILALAHYFKNQGKTVAILSRGYKGKLNGPVQVNPDRHQAADVGDEPLLLAQVAPTWIAKNRYQGAQAALAKNSSIDLLLLDDGLQNKTLKQDGRLCVVDAKRGFGNGCVLPAGPLRESLAKGLKTVDALIMIGGDLSIPSIPFKGPLLKATVHMNKEDRGALQGKKLIAFAGLAHPDKFFDTLTAEGFDVVESVPFPDHHPYTAADLQPLIGKAQAAKAVLVTTEKDWVRVPSSLQKQILSVGIHLAFEDLDQLGQLMKRILTAHETSV